VKRLSADDSAHSRVKVGHRQANISQENAQLMLGVFVCGEPFASSRNWWMVFVLVPYESGQVTLNTG
jgi:hypothetical protein